MTTTAYITATAKVFGQAGVYGQAQVYGRAQVRDQAWVFGQAQVYDQALVYDSAQVYGQAQIHGQARVYDRADVYGQAQVYGRADVYGQARIADRGDIASARHYFTVGPIGSEDRTVTVHRHYDGPGSTAWGHLIIAGCWSGMRDELAARIAADRTHGWGDDASRWRADYEGLIALARPRVAEWAAEPLTARDHARWAGVVGTIEREETE